MKKWTVTTKSQLCCLFGLCFNFCSSSFNSNGKAVEYNGGRTADTIVAWVEKKTGPPAVTLEDVEAAKKFIEDNKVAIVGFFKVKFSFPRFDNFRCVSSTLTRKLAIALVAVLQNLWVRNSRL